MDQKKSYEIIITDKLQQLTVPDMADAIWARIEMQLDLDMPTDEGPGPDNQPPVNGGGGLTLGTPVIFFLAALVVLFILFRKPAAKDSINLPDTAADPASLPERGVAPIVPSSDPENRNIFQFPATEMNVNDEMPGADSVLSDLTSQPLIRDSLKRDEITMPARNVPDSSAPKPKTKGVTGISDNDYKIVPVKKDST